MSSPSQPAATRLLLVADDGALAVFAVLRQYQPAGMYGSTAFVAQAMKEGFDARPLESLSALTFGEEIPDDTAAQRAAIDAVEGAVAQHRGDTIVLCVDANLLLGLVCYGLGVPLSAGAHFRVEVAAITVIEVDAAGRWALVRLNEQRPCAGS